MSIMKIQKLVVGIAAAAGLTLLGVGVANAADPPPRGAGWPGTAEPLDWPKSTAPASTVPATSTGFVDPGPGAPQGPFGGGPRW
jgi:hypothetical protein